jgi:hypothetical protein
MSQISLTEHVEALEKAGVLTRYSDEKRVDELPHVLHRRPGHLGRVGGQQPPLRRSGVLVGELLVKVLLVAAAPAGSCRDR